LAKLLKINFNPADLTQFSTMQIKSLNERIFVHRPAGFSGLELRRGFSVSQPYPRHWHEEFHFCLILDGSGELNYRRKRHLTPAGSLFIVHPGEVHSNQSDAGGSCSFRNLYAEPEIIAGLTTEILGEQTPLPFFSAQPEGDAEINRLYLKLHKSLETEANRLEQDALLLDFLTRLITRHSQTKTASRKFGRESMAVNQARDYLADNFAENVSLEDLARLTGLSLFHLNRAFSREFGLPPHAFQTQVRIARAKTQLRQGATISQAAFDAGFVDQSHFTRHFRRLVGVTPGYYLQASKNVQDLKSTSP